jgi:hypothetical protein
VLTARVPPRLLAELAPPSRVQQLWLPVATVAVGAALAYRVGVNVVPRASAAATEAWAAVKTLTVEYVVHPCLQLYASIRYNERQWVIIRARASGLAAQLTMNKKRAGLRSCRRLQ